MATPVLLRLCPECDGFAAVVIRDTDSRALVCVQCPVCVGTGTVAR
ncbi:hypothetical protein [Acrocarpospora macrocephala]|nr:hypothetical protein [Acrocarpospora macrocephala]